MTADAGSVDPRRGRAGGRHLRQSQAGKARSADCASERPDQSPRQRREQSRAAADPRIQPNRDARGFNRKAGQGIKADEQISLQQMPIKGRLVGWLPAGDQVRAGTIDLLLELGMRRLKIAIGLRQVVVQGRAGLARDDDSLQVQRSGHLGGTQQDGDALAHPREIVLRGWVLRAF